MEKIRIVFMGTPEFAAGILDIILKNNYDVVGVVTVADKPAGRGQKVCYSAVKEYSIAHNLKLFQPTNLKDECFLAELKSLNANLQIVVAFRMLPKVVWEIPSLGTFNLHASILPNYRGAAPINWAIINGETTTGVTTFFIDDKIDTGAIIMSSEIDIKPTENAGQLHDRLMLLGGEVVVKTLSLIEQGKVHTKTQQEELNLKTANKLNKDNCRIDISKPAQEIYNLIRGLSPYPVAWCLFCVGLTDKITVKIYEASIIIEKHDYEIGKLICSKKEMKIAVEDGFIKIENLQLSGKKRMGVMEFLNGNTFTESVVVI